MPQSRPVFLNIAAIRFPVAAITSILHRVSGVVLFLALPFFLWQLSALAGGAKAFNAMQATLQAMPLKIIHWAVLSSVAYHVLAGLRHLMMDFGVGITRCGAQRSAWCMLVLALGAVLFLGWRIVC